VLAGEAKRGAARREHAHARGGGEQGAHGLRVGSELLEVVEDEEQREVAEVLEHRRVEVFAALRQLERPADRRQHELRVDDRREVGEDGAVPQLGREGLGGGQAEPCLPRPSGAGERHEPHVVPPEQRLDGGDLEPPPDE